MKLVSGYQKRSPDSWPDLDLLNELEGIAGIARGLKTNPKEGLKGDDNEARKDYFGSNRRTPAKVRGLCKIMWDVLGDTLLRVLFFSGIVSIIINEIFDDDKSIGKWQCV